MTTPGMEVCEEYEPPLVNDDIVEDDESFALVLFMSSLFNVFPGLNDTILIEILDDDGTSELLLMHHPE